jgi:hypothetical protein
MPTETGRNVYRTGIYTYNLNNQSLGDGTPVAYYSIIGAGKGQGGMFQIGSNWFNPQQLYYRSLRDFADNWTPWTEIYTTQTSNLVKIYTVDFTYYTGQTETPLTVVGARVGDMSYISVHRDNFASGQVAQISPISFRSAVTANDTVQYKIQTGGDPLPTYKYTMTVFQ